MAVPQTLQETARRTLKLLNASSMPIKTVLDAIQSQDSGLKVRCYFLLGEYDACRQLLSINGSGGDLAHLSIHERVCVLQALSIQGMFTIDVSGNFTILNLVLTEESSADSKLRQCFTKLLTDDTFMLPLLNATADWKFWVEMALYELFFRSLIDEDDALTTEMARLYLEILAYMPTSFRPLYRISVLRNYIWHLLANYRWIGYIPPTCLFQQYAFGSDLCDIDMSVEMYLRQIPCRRSYPFFYRCMNI